MTKQDQLKVLQQEIEREKELRQIKIQLIGGICGNDINLYSQLMTQAEVSRFFEVNPSCVGRWIAKGKLFVDRTSKGRKLVRREEVLVSGQYLEQLLGKLDYMARLLQRNL